MSKSRPDPRITTEKNRTAIYRRAEKLGIKHIAVEFLEKFVSCRRIHASSLKGKKFICEGYKIDGENTRKIYLAVNGDVYDIENNWHVRTVAMRDNQIRDAAHDMLAALRAGLAIIETATVRAQKYGCHDSDAEAVEAQIRAAIAKAEGKP